MGYYVTLKEDDRRLIEKLRSDPSEVFGRPYAGYLLFLIGGTDDSAVEWLKKHLVSLDSLTGAHIAFAVFAAKVPVQLEVHDPAPQPFKPRNVTKFLGDIPLSDVRRIDSYIQAGKHGFVLEGDSLNAMTYGTDTVARSFGVLQHLPCLLAFDAFASTDFVVIEMDDDQLPNLFPMLRIAMGKLNKDPKFAKVVQSLELLGNIKQRLADISNKIRERQYELSLLPVETDEQIADKINDFYEKIFAGLRSGSHREVRRQLTGLRKYVGEIVIDDLDESTGQKVVGFGKTIAVLNEFGNKRWPLGPADDDLCRKTIANHVTRLLPTISVPPVVADPERLQTIKGLLINEQSALIDQIMSAFPDKAELIAYTIHAFAVRRSRIGKKLDRLRDELGQVREKGKQQLEWCISEESPSLSRIIKRESQKHKIKLMAASGATYAGRLLDPQKIFKIIAGATGFAV